MNNNWKLLTPNQKDGHLYWLSWYDEDFGEYLSQTLMRWCHIQQNGMFPGVVGMWATPDGNMTWCEANGGGPTHYKVYTEVSL